MAKQRPESRWTVAIADGVLIEIDPNGVRCETRIDRIRTICIVTNDTGPWGADVWWVFEGRSNAVLSAFPQGATGDKDVVDWATALPDFNHVAMIAAMGCAANARFVVWSRGDA